MKSPFFDILIEFKAVLDFDIKEQNISVPSYIRNIILNHAIEVESRLTRDGKSFLENLKDRHVFAYESLAYDDCDGDEVQMWELYVFSFKAETLYVTTYSWDNWNTKSNSIDYRLN